MALFQYKAVTAAGEVMEGMLDAGSQAEAVASLQSQGYIPIRTEAAGDKAGKARSSSTASKSSAFASLLNRRVTGDEITVVTQEIATLLKAGMPLDRAMEVLVQLAEHDGVRDLLISVRNDVRGGEALSTALDKHKAQFDRFYVNMVRAGEAGGALSNVLNRLSDYRIRAKELRNTITSAMIYPVILFFVTGGSIIYLMTSVVPKFKPVFKQSKKAMPPLTEFIMKASDFLSANWILMMIVLASALLVVMRMMKSPTYKPMLDRLWLKVPLFGPLIERLETARLTRTLGTLLSNGVPLVNAMGIAKETLGNSYMAAALTAVTRDMKEGRGFGKPLMETNRFPKFAVHMIMVGEETGQLDELLFQVADVYDREVSAAVKRLLSALEPVMIVTLGAIIGIIVTGLLSAIFDMMQV
jgi:general secretion pathway protein F